METRFTDAETEKDADPRIIAKEDHYEVTLTTGNAINKDQDDDIGGEVKVFDKPTEKGMLDKGGPKKSNIFVLWCCFASIMIGVSAALRGV